MDAKQVTETKLGVRFADPDPKPEWLRRCEDRERQNARLAIACVIVALGVLMFCSCAAPANRDMPPRPSFEAAVGGMELSARGPSDVAEAGPVPVLELSGTTSFEDELTGATGEWLVQYGQVSAADVDAGDLGTFDLEGDVLRAGMGLRLRTSTVGQLDWSLGLGGLVTLVSAEASAGGESRNIDKSGLGAYFSAMVGRGPLFLRVSYLGGPDVEIEDEDVHLGGVSAVVGVRVSL
jgi:hypothetical protein